MPVRILDEETINKIAAGEVIERPYSVVKELIENSIDANANNILIEVKNGGKDYIKVSDDGIGMSKKDTKLCYFKHATSKLNDLFNINTLGFRGEALSSIAAVSNLIIKTNNNKESIKLEIEAGKIISESEVGMNQGTVIEVSDLFFNTPARKNYLKSKEQEFQKIQDIIIRYSFSNKNISFKLIHDDKEILSSPKTERLINKIVDIYGLDIARNLMEINEEKIQGFIGKPYITKTDKSFQTLFINGRYVKNEVVSKAIQDAYRTLLFLDRHPVIILNIIIDFTKIDVNVHPSKDIIRLENEDEVYKLVFNAIRDTFKNNNLTPEVKLNKSNRIVNKYEITKDTQTNLPVENATKKIQIKENQGFNSKIGSVKVLDQLNKTYILAENDKGLLIIDQHAMQERINFEKLLDQYKNKKIETQQLLQPIIIELPQKIFNNIKQYNLKELGFDIDEYGNKTFIIRQIPKIILLRDKNSIINLLTDLENFDKINQDKIDEIVARVACRKSIKAGDELTLIEMNKLVKEINFCRDPYACPHGRPTMITITISELEKKFKRV